MPRPALFLLLVLAAPAQAAPALSLPLGEDAEVVPARYICDDGGTIAVQYVNAGPNRLALLRLDGEERLFVNVISASGARYVAGEYEWWIKGGQASLRNAMRDGDARSCRTRDGA